MASAAVGVVGVPGFLLGGRMALRNGEYSFCSDGIWSLKLLGRGACYASGTIGAIRNYPARSKVAGMVSVS